MRSPTTAVYAVLCMLQTIILVTKVDCSGIFELQLKKFANTGGRNNAGNCCNGYLLNGVQQCSATCKTFLRICLTHYQVNIIPNTECTFGSEETILLGNNTIDFTTDLSASFKNPIQFPIEMTWPGTFSLIIEAWHDTTLTGPSEGSPRELIARMAIQRSVDVGYIWTNQNYRYNNKEIEYSYRMVCDQHYYGAGCSDLCRPRDDMYGHYTCSSNGTMICLEGWQGPYCAEAACLPGCHSSYGFCQKPNECQCRFGWQGHFCDQCIVHPDCSNGYCTNKPWECTCRDGWGGNICNLDLNFCTHHKPCRNGGTCKNTGEGSYTCTCPEGFSGTNCEVDIDDCEVLPCLNGGSCKDIGNGFHCSCPVGFYGRICENPAASCENSPCQNQGTCVDADRAYMCFCAPGFTGPNCDLESNECNRNPCKNDGRCIDEVDGYRCVCSAGFGGPNCLENLDDCSRNPCLNEGACIDDINDYRCKCRPGFVGSHCEININDCLIRPCANGGTCHDLINDFMCTCVLGFTGKDCSTNINECENAPCQNGGLCQDHIADYECTCDAGYWGKQCQYRDGDDPNVLSTTDISQRNISGTQKYSMDDGSGLTIQQLLLIVCLGTGIPLLLIIVLVVILLFRKKQTLHHQNMDKEKEQNTVNNINNKCIDSNIFTTIPHSSSSIVKTTNEDQDCNKFKPKHIYLDKSSNKKYFKDLNTREQLSKRDFEKPYKKLDVDSLSVDTSTDISDHSTIPDIVRVKSINNDNRSSVLILDQQHLRHNNFSNDRMLATEV